MKIIKIIKIEFVSKKKNNFWRKPNTHEVAKCKKKIALLSIAIKFKNLKFLTRIPKPGTGSTLKKSKRKRKHFILLMCSVSSILIAMKTAKES